MNFRIPLIVTCTAVCAATVAGVIVQGRQLGDLRTEHNRLENELQAGNDTAGPGAVPRELLSSNSPSLELLRLRNEASQLTKRRRELNNVTAENDNLRVQVAVSRTNTAKPPSSLEGYLRQSTAQNRGFNTPENTLETFYWALHHRDITTLTQAFGPETLQQLQKQLEKSARTQEDFFKGAENVPPMRILDRQQLSDGTVELTVGSLPDVQPAEQKMRFHFIDGQWKLEMK